MKKMKKKSLVGWIINDEFSHGIFPIFKTKFDSTLDYEVRQLIETRPTKVRITMERFPNED